MFTKNLSIGYEANCNQRSQLCLLNEFFSAYIFLIRLCFHKNESVSLFIFNRPVIAMCIVAWEVVWMSGNKK